MKRWRLISYSTYDAFYNMAIDEAVATCVSDGISPPTLRFYGWSLPSVSIGAFQRVDCVDHRWCALNGVAVVRRPTGGRAVVHNNELTYCFASNFSNGFTKSVLNNYKIVNAVFHKSLRRLGLEVDFIEGRLNRQGLLLSSLCFAATSYGEVSAFGKKVIGAAQKRLANGFIEQGSIPLSVDRELVSKTLKVDETQDVLVGLLELSGKVNLSELTQTIRDNFEESFGITFDPSGLTPEEDLLVQQFLLKYQGYEWTHRR
ncbi:MAG: lipoate--protein ligase family protein [Nitrospirae bacterium]|nr:lipoate--protein ligase family protein [Nitrospirota bacterium]